MDSGIDFKRSLSVLSKVLKKMGFRYAEIYLDFNVFVILVIIFRWRKTADNRMILHESYDIRLKRINYLKQLKQYIDEKRPIIYTDESYIHSSRTLPMGWTDDSTKFMKKPISKGQRAVIVHAGGKDGFIPNALLIFKSGIFGVIIC